LLLLLTSLLLLLLSLLAQRGTDVIMFGGEFSDHVKDKVYVYKDLYKFSTDKQRWSQVVTKG
jgi:hypothetical protein